MSALPEVFATQLETLAMELAGAMVEANAASAAVDAAEEHRARIASRVAALAEEREAIIGRRSTGRHDLDDGAALALNQADSEGLQPILREAAERVSEAEARRAALAARAAQLRFEIDQVESLAAREALIRHADDLAGKLLETIQALEQKSRQTGHSGRSLWAAPVPLYQALRKFAAERNEL
jgi:chromosome segregation ATPase